MLYLIGGPPRVGKSTMAQRLLDEHKLPYVSTDGLTVMLRPIGEPEFYSPVKAEKFFPFLELFISRILPVGPDYVIEGDAFEPEHVAKLQKKYDLRCIFLTMNHTTVDQIVEHAHYDHWINGVARDELSNLVIRIQNASLEIESDCAKLDIPCFDMSDGYDSRFESAYRSLMDM